MSNVEIRKRGRRPKKSEVSNVRIPIVIGKENYIVTTDKYNWIINKIAVDKDGEEVLSGNKFFGTLNGMMNSLIEMNLKRANLSSFDEVYSEFNKLKKEINSWFIGFSQKSRV